CGDDSNAPPGNIDAPTGGSGGGGMSGSDGGGGNGGNGGKGGMAGVSRGRGPGAVENTAGHPARQTLTPKFTRVRTDGAGGSLPYCGCANDAFCQQTGTCRASDGRCYCGSGLPCVQGITVCVAGRCVNVDAGP